MISGQAPPPPAAPLPLTSHPLPASLPPPLPLECVPVSAEILYINISVEKLRHLATERGWFVHIISHEDENSSHTLNLNLMSKVT